jgi:hypothetical protein
MCHVIFTYMSSMSRMDLFGQDRNSALSLSLFMLRVSAQHVDLEKTNKPSSADVEAVEIQTKFASQRGDYNSSASG